MNDVRINLRHRLSEVNKKREKWQLIVNSFPSSDPFVNDVSILVHNILDEDQQTLESLTSLSSQNSNNRVDPELHSGAVKRLSAMIQLNKKLVDENLELQKKLELYTKQIQTHESRSKRKTEEANVLKLLWNFTCQHFNLDHSISTSNLEKICTLIAQPTSSSSSNHLQRENIELKETLKKLLSRVKSKLRDYQCPICFDNRIRLYTCNTCADRIFQTTAVDPFTREPIEQVVHDALAFAPSPANPRRWTPVRPSVAALDLSL
ncbi:hypothetical protein RCL1_000747 [Eukaryota sp. TZLM3-RCL]